MCCFCFSRREIDCIKVKAGAIDETDGRAKIIVTSNCNEDRDGESLQERGRKKAELMPMNGTF